VVVSHRYCGNREKGRWERVGGGLQQQLPLSYEIQKLNCTP